MQSVGAAAAADTTAALPSIAVLSQRVIRIMGLNPGPMTLHGSNTYLVGTGTDRLLIDSGEGVPAYEALLHKAVIDESSKLGRPVRVSTLLLTHWHDDHVGGFETVRRLFPQVQLLKRPSLYTPTSADPLCAEPPEEIAVEGATLKLLHTPGHTDDHVCAFLEEEQALFTSDTILGTGSSVFSCFTDYMATLRALKALHPLRLYPAHGPVVEDGEQRIEETIQHRLLREGQILQALYEHATSTNSSSADAATSGLNMKELVDAIYTNLSPQLKTAAGTNVFHHVKKLIHEGKAHVCHAPSDLTAYLQDATDYTIFGEGASAESSMMHRLLTEIYVAAV